MIWRHIADWLEGGAGGCLVTIVRASGSTPREAGTCMAIGPGGQYTGTIGGGALEWEAIAIARDLIARHPEGHGLARTFALGPALGQCCGGSMLLRFEVFSPADHEWVSRLARAEAGGTFSTTGIADARGIVIRAIAVSEQVAPGERETFGERRRSVLLFGAGHVGRALVLALAPLPFDVRWIDSRADAFPAAVPRNVTIAHAEEANCFAGNFLCGDIAVVVTHSHALDFEIVSNLLREKSFAFVGLIGSNTKRNRFISRLKDSGFDQLSLSRLTCPIGLPGIAGKAPAVIAASVAAQLLMLPEPVTGPA